MHEELQHKDLFLLQYQENTLFSPMQGFINRTTVGLESCLKMGLYNIFPFPAEERRQGSFIPTPSANGQLLQAPLLATWHAPSSTTQAGHQGLDLLLTELVTFSFMRQKQSSASNAASPRSDSTGRR